jgi:hypothetical protein
MQLLNFMGISHSSMQKINFEDMQSVYKNPEIYLLINTLEESEQGCLISGTIGAQQEVTLINKHLQQNRQIRIIVYGRNCNDEKIYIKYQQLIKLGFQNVFLYCGGLFEWLMLQDIYGQDEFPTTTKQLDFLKYKPRQLLNVGLLEYR